MLRDAGISVDVGLFCDEARKINEGFLSRVERKRPFVTLKLAATMDAPGPVKVNGSPATRHANTDTCYGPITMPFWLGRKLFLQMTRR